MPPKTKNPPYEREKCLFLSTLVGDTAIHILHESYLFNSELWPAGGFMVDGYGGPIMDCISYGVNPYGWNQYPIIGRLVLCVWNYKKSRVDLQFDQIKLILDYTYMNDILFEDDLRNSYITDMLYFKFTYTPKK